MLMKQVSVNIHNDVSAPHVRYSLMLMQWAQFLDHDVTHTPVNRFPITFLCRYPHQYTC
jgi:hypothetical protein